MRRNSHFMGEAEECEVQGTRKSGRRKARHLYGEQRIYYDADTNSAVSLAYTGRPWSP